MANLQEQSEMKKEDGELYNPESRTSSLKAWGGIAMWVILALILVWAVVQFVPSG